MSRLWKTVRTPMLLGLCAALSGLGATAVIAQEETTQEDDAQKRVRVLVKKSTASQECDGEDCATHRFVFKGSPDDDSRVVFIGDDGEVEELGGENVFVHRARHGRVGHGGNATWVGDGGAELHFGGGFLGVQLTELTDALRDHFGVRSGVGVMISEVVAGSPAERAGFRAGDVITAVDGEEIAGASALTRRVRNFEEGETASFEIVRERAHQRLAATIGKRELRTAQFRASSGDEMVFGGEGHGNVFFHECDGDDCKVEIIEKIRERHGDAPRVIQLDGVDLQSFDCGGAAECEVQVTCDDGDCSCEVNGEAVACGR